jgi:hypothetical protein
VCVFHSKFSKDSDSSLYIHARGFLNANVSIAPFSGVNIKFILMKVKWYPKFLKNYKNGYREPIIE